MTNLNERKERWNWSSYHLILLKLHPGPSLKSAAETRIFVKKKTSQELRMLSRSLADCKSLTFYVMIQVCQFVSNSQLCH